MAQFFPLLVTDIHHTIRDAVVLTLEPESPADFTFVQGQYLTFKRDFDGTELRRNYSICAGLDDGKIQVGIKRVVMPKQEQTDRWKESWNKAKEMFRESGVQWEFI